MPHNDTQYLIRDEVYAVIDRNDSARILLKDGGKARLLAHRMQEQGMGSPPYRVARVVVMELLEEPASYPTRIKGMERGSKG